MKLNIKKFIASTLAVVTIIGSIGVCNTSNAYDNYHKVTTNKITRKSGVQLLYKGRWVHETFAYENDYFKVTSYGNERFKVGTKYKTMKFAYGTYYKKEYGGYGKLNVRVNFHSMKMKIPASVLGKKKNIIVRSYEEHDYVSKDSTYYKNSKYTQTYEKGAYDYVKNRTKYVCVVPLEVLGSNKKIYFPYGIRGTENIKGSKGFKKSVKVKYYAHREVY